MTSKSKKKRGPKPVKIRHSNTVIPINKANEWRTVKYYIEHAREYPLMGCWIMEGWKEGGLTPVVVARKQDEDKVIFGVFLVDYYCLGVKNAICNGDFSLNRFSRELPGLLMEMPVPCDPGLAHALIYGSIDYARKYGFEPHQDYKLASMVLDPPGTHAYEGELEFGHEGKPLFVSGPKDNIGQILAKLQRTAGDGNYHYLAVSGSPEDFELD
jgi:hypothetical protein